MQGHMYQAGNGWNGGNMIHWYNYPGMGKAGFNWFGSAPTLADAQWEPNFRHFDWFMDRNPGNIDLIERVWRVPEGEAHYNLSEYAGGQCKTFPIILCTLMNATFLNYICVKALQKSHLQNRWNWYFVCGLVYIYHNTKAFMSREKMFQRDFQRNQMYAQDEYMNLRKDLRVRQALYELQYVNDPVSEYRLKEFLVSKRWN